MGEGNTARRRLKNDPGVLARYGAGQIHFAGSDSGLYERHLMFDNVIAAGADGRA